jgi:hypothetical protein
VNLTGGGVTRDVRSAQIGERLPKMLEKLQKIPFFAVFLLAGSIHG